MECQHHKLYLIFFLLFLSVFLNTKDALGSSCKNTFVIDDQTRIRFSMVDRKSFISPFRMLLMNQQTFLMYKI